MCEWVREFVAYREDITPTVSDFLQKWESIWLKGMRKLVGYFFLNFLLLLWVLLRPSEKNNEVNPHTSFIPMLGQTFRTCFVFTGVRKKCDFLASALTQSIYQNDISERREMLLEMTYFEIFWHPGRQKLAQACGVPAVDCWQWRRGHYFHPYFLFFPRRVDLLCHFGAPWRPFWILQAVRRCRRLASTPFAARLVFISALRTPLHSALASGLSVQCIGLSRITDNRKIVPPCRWTRISHFM